VSELTGLFLDPHPPIHVERGEASLRDIASRHGEEEEDRERVLTLTGRMYESEFIENISSGPKHSVHKQELGKV
jgi:hypothetical protein